MAQCMFSSHLISVPIACLECVHASGHVFMYTKLSMLAQPLYALLHGNLGSSVWQCVCVFQSPYHWSHTLIKMCTCISTCIHVHLTDHVCFTFWNSDMDIWVPLCGNVCMCVCVLQSACLWCHTLIKMCTCISTCIYVNLSSELWYTPFA